MQTGQMRLGRIAVLVGLALIADAPRQTGSAWEHGLLNDFHFSIREELSDERKFQIDNYYAMDLYRIGGKVDFHSAFLITNDLNLLDREAVQLTLAYLNLDRLLNRFTLRAGRQLFSEGFDAFLGDGLYTEIRATPLLTVSLHVAVPFDAESEAIENEPMLVYGVGLEAGGWSEGSPLVIGASVERRDRTNVDGLDQTLVGLRAAAELRSPLASDVYGALEYEAEEARLRGMRVGSRLHLGLRVMFRLEARMYDPDPRRVNEQAELYLSDAIVNSFSGSEVWSGRAALSYSLRQGRELRVSYSGQWYDRSSGEHAFGQVVDCFFTFLSAPSLGATVGAGYSALLFEEDSFHVATFRGSAVPLPRLEARFLAESGILDTWSWEDAFVLHLRGQIEYAPRPNLRISLAVEENRNPYFNSDLRGMMFVRYFWASGVR